MLTHPGATSIPSISLEGQLPACEASGRYSVPSAEAAAEMQELPPRAPPLIPGFFWSEDGGREGLMGSLSSGSELLRETPAGNCLRFPLLVCLSVCSVAQPASHGSQLPGSYFLIHSTDPLSDHPSFPSSDVDMGHRFFLHMSSPDPGRHWVRLSAR